MRQIVHRFILTTLAVCAAFTASAQGERYFIDGFHGGVYGHYPLETYTDYMMTVLKENPSWAFGLEIEPETWDSVKVVTPDAYRRFVRLVTTDDRVEYTNPTYAQPYMYNVLGESVIRQFELGIRKLRSHFPGITFSTYAVEEPCFTSCLPMVLSGFGFKYATLKNPNTCWGGYMAASGGELIRWTSKDGSSVIASPRHGIEGLGGDVWTTESNGLYPGYFAKADSAGFKHPVGFTYQDAGWTNGPWMGTPPDTREGVRYTTWTKFFESVASDVEPEDYAADQEDVRGALVWGSQVLQRIARSVRRSENNLLSAEKMGVMARLGNGWEGPDPRWGADLDEGWRNLLLAQHHDSWIVPYNGLKKQGSWADWICGRWTPKADEVADRYSQGAVYATLGGRYRPSGDAAPAVRVFNTLGLERTGVVSMDIPSIAPGSAVAMTDPDGNPVECWNGLVDGVHRLVFRADVPGLGYNTYSLSVSEATPKSVCRRVRKVETGDYRIVFNPRKGGTIKKFIDKRSGKNLAVRGKGVAFGEIKGFFYDEGRFRSSAEATATVTLIEDNPLEKKVRICGSIAGHPFSETLTLREGDQRIDIALEIDWKANVGIGAYRQSDAYANPERAFYDDRYHLNIYFPVCTEGASLIKNAPFDVCRSKEETTNFHNWKDIKHNVILGWADLEASNGDSFAMLTDHTTSYVYDGSLLGLTVQSSGNGLWGRDYKIDGPTVMNIAIVPHKGNWYAAEMHDRIWNEPMKPFILGGIDLKQASFMELADSGWELSAARIEGDGVMVRFYNAVGDGSEKAVYLPSGVASAVEVDLLGNELAPASLEQGPEGAVLRAAIPEHGIKTFILRQ